MIRDAVVRVTGCGDHATLDGTDVDAIAVRQQLIELAAVRSEVRTEPEDPLERLLHLQDALPDRDAAAEPRLEMRRRRQVVCVGVRLEDPVDFQSVGLAVRDEWSADFVAVRPDRQS